MTMGRPKIAVTNYDKSGRVTPGKWHVRIGNQWTVFNEADWQDHGIAWINEQLVGAK